MILYSNKPLRERYLKCLVAIETNPRPIFIEQGAENFMALSIGTKPRESSLCSAQREEPDLHIRKKTLKASSLRSKLRRTCPKRKTNVKKSPKQ